MDTVDLNNIDWVLRQEFLVLPSAKDRVLETGKGPLQSLLNICGDLAFASTDTPLSCRRLGHYFEGLVQFILSAPGVTERRHFNLLVKQDQKTLGEIDALVQLSGQIHPLHIEMALKYYLHVPEVSDDLASLIGPDPSDNLLRKWSHLQTVQLGWSDTAAFAGVAPSWSHAPTKVPLMLGRVFRSVLAPNAPLPPLCNPTCVSGVWVHADDPRIHQYFGAHSHLITDRRLWLDSPGRLQPTQSIASAIEHHFARSRFALMVVNQSRDLPERVMVVPPGWPQVSIT